LTFSGTSSPKTNEPAAAAARESGAGKSSG
jgi:hypothetical protein